MCWRRNGDGSGRVLEMLISVHKRTFHVHADEWDAYWQEVQRGEWEPETFALLERFTDAQHSMIDLGAWIGPTVLYACQRVRAVYALEPDPVAFGKLAANVALNQPRSANIHLFNTAIANKNGALWLNAVVRAGDSASTTLAHKAERSWRVQAVRLEDFAQQNKIDDCNFIKMDIEGGEFRVIPSAARWLEQIRPVLYLSLHPAQLYWSGARVLRLSPPLRAKYVADATKNVLDALAFYRHCYTAHGKPIARTEIIERARKLENTAFVLADAW